MANDFLDSLGINITADTQQSIKAITNLIGALERLDRKTQQGKDFGFAALSAQINKFAESIKDAIPAMESYTRMLEEIRLASGKSTSSVSSGTRRAASDTRSSAATMKKSFDGVGDSIKIIGKEATSVQNILRTAFSGSGASNMLFAKMGRNAFDYQKYGAMMDGLRNQFIQRFAPASQLMLPGREAPLMLEAHNASESMKTLYEYVDSIGRQNVFYGMSVEVGDVKLQLLAAAKAAEELGDNLADVYTPNPRHGGLIENDLFGEFETAKTARETDEAANHSSILTEEWKEFNSIVSVCHKKLQGVRKLLGGLASGVASATSAINRGILNNFTGTFRKIGSAAQGLLRRIGRISLYRIVREVLAKAFDNIYEGFENLYYWASVVGYKFSDAMDSIASSSLLVRNAFATMAEPLVSSVYPIVEQIAALVSKFLAELLGRDSYVVAKSFSRTYKDSLDDVASGASGAADAINEYKRTLMGFDELNPINDVNDSSSGGGGGGGGGSGYSSADYEQMFEEQATDLSSWAAQLGEAWRNAEWDTFAEMIYTKINDLIEGFDAEYWGTLIGSKVQTGITVALDITRNLKMETAGSKLAEFLNNLIDEIKPEDLGALFAQKIQLAVEFVSGFSSDFDWSGTGKWLSGIVNGWFNEIDFKLAGSALASSLTGIVDSIIEFLETLEWEDIGQSVSDFVSTALTDVTTWLNEKDWDEVGENIVTDISDLIKGLTTDESAEALAEFFKAVLKAAWNLSLGVLGEIGEKLQELTGGKVTWVLDGQAYTFDLEAEREKIENAVTASNIMLEIAPMLSPTAARFMSSVQSAIDSESSSNPVTLSVYVSPLQSSVEAADAGYWQSIIQENAPNWFNGGIELNANLVSLTDNIPEEQRNVTSHADVKSAKDNIPASQKVIPDMTSQFSKRGYSSNYDKTLYGLTSQFRYRSFSPNYDKTLYGLNSQFRYRSFSSNYDKTLYGFNSQFRFRSFSPNYDKTLYGLTSQFRYRTFSSYYDSTIYGMTAQVSSVYLSSNAKAELRASLRGELVMAKGGVFVNGRVQPIQSFASGGFPGGQLFRAREAGPELVGTLKGHTAVMNNDQIVASVSAGVARAISSIQFHMTGFPTYGGIDEETLYRAFYRALNDADIGGDTYLDGDVLYRKMRDRNMMNTRMTGVNAFA